MSMHPMYAATEEMQIKIDEYFIKCAGKPFIVDGEQMYDKLGYPIFTGTKPPTVTGIALYLGFTSRQALLNYQAKETFVDTVTRAKARVEEYAETRLFDKDGANGAKFSLANNFKGWTEKQQVESFNTNLNVGVTDITEARKMLLGAGIDPDKV